MRGRWRTGEKLMRKRNLSGGKRFLEDKPVKFVNLSVGKRFLTDKWPPQAGLSVKCALFTDKEFNSEKNSADVCDSRYATPDSEPAIHFPGRFASNAVSESAWHRVKVVSELLRSARSARPVEVCGETDEKTELVRRKTFP